MVQKRDITIDILRGFAIFTMVAANMAAEVLAEPHPFWFRLYSTFAAPLFILISGMMVAYTAETKNYNLRHFLVRGGMIMAVGALVDVLVYKIYPFMAVDVLYLIGLSIPLANLSLHLNSLYRWIIVFLIFIATPVLQKILGYSDYPNEIYLWGEQVAEISNQTSIFNHWTVDGFFPLFPWTGFSLLGVNLARLRWKSRQHSTFGRNTIFLLGSSILIIGSIIWRFYPGSLLIREGYSELFYPPTIGYVMSSIGLILILFFIVDLKPAIVIYKPLQVLGESSLFLYVLHLALIEYVIAPLWPEKNIQTFLLIYVVLSCFLIVVAYGVRALKDRWKDRPFIIRFLFGN